MTAQEQSTLKTLILHNGASDSFELPAYRLLNDFGHDVATTDSADEAVELLQHDRTDLVVIDADRPGQREFVSRLTALPPDQQPRQLAIFSDALDDSLSTLMHRLTPGRVHVLLKPLHMHGLLGVLRTIEAKS
jgi:CheY-like chemotaxis protein